MQKVKISPHLSIYFLPKIKTIQNFHPLRLYCFSLLETGLKWLKTKQKSYIINSKRPPEPPVTFISAAGWLPWGIWQGTWLTPDNSWGFCSILIYDLIQLSQKLCTYSPQHVTSERPSMKDRVFSPHCLQSRAVHTVGLLKSSECLSLWECGKNDSFISSWDELEFE